MSEYAPLFPSRMLSVPRTPRKGPSDSRGSIRVSRELYDRLRAIAHAEDRLIGHVLERLVAAGLKAEGLNG